MPTRKGGHFPSGERGDLGKRAPVAVETVTDTDARVSEAKLACAVAPCCPKLVVVARNHRGMHSASGRMDAPSGRRCKHHDLCRRRTVSCVPESELSIAVVSPRPHFGRDESGMHIVHPEVMREVGVADQQCRRTALPESLNAREHQHFRPPPLQRERRCQ